MCFSFYLLCSIFSLRNPLKSPTPPPFVFLPTPLLHSSYSTSNHEKGHTSPLHACFFEDVFLQTGLFNNVVSSLFPVSHVQLRSNPFTPDNFCHNAQHTSHFFLCHVDSAASDTPTLTLRGFTYQALGQLAKRSPQLFQKDSDIAAQFFSALSVEPPGVRAALQEAVSTLASAYKDCSGMGCC